MKTLQQLADDALQVQNACNLQAVIKGMDRMITDLKEIHHNQLDTIGIRHHPIVRMWASKVHDLADMGLSDMDAYGRAYAWCQEQAANHHCEIKTVAFDRLPVGTVFKTLNGQINRRYTKRMAYTKVDGGIEQYVATTAEACRFYFTPETQCIVLALPETPEGEIIQIKEGKE